jgi:hypothetical protein
MVLTSRNDQLINVIGIIQVINTGLYKSRLAIHKFKNHQLKILQNNLKFSDIRFIR